MRGHAMNRWGPVHDPVNPNPDKINPAPPEQRVTRWHGWSRDPRAYSQRLWRKFPNANQKR
jgi:hypothetical protein